MIKEAKDDGLAELLIVRFVHLEDLVKCIDIDEVAQDVIFGRPLEAVESEGNGEAGKLELAYLVVGCRHVDGRWL